MSHLGLQSRSPNRLLSEYGLGEPMYCFGFRSEYMISGYRELLTSNLLTGYAPAPILCNIN